MNNFEYLKLLVIGLNEHRTHFPQYLKREQLKAEKNEFIEFSEFIGRLINTLELLENELRNKYYEEKGKFLLCKNGTNDEEIDKIISDLSMNNYALTISHLTNNRLFGDAIYLQDISWIRQSINEAFTFISIDGKSNSYKLLDGNGAVNEVDEESSEDEEAVTLNEFFIEGIPQEKIDIIQANYKNYSGKRMAVLIYVLEKEFNLITYIPNSKTHSRKHFVLAFTNKETCKMQGINKYFEANGGLKVNHKDADFVSIKENLLQIL